MLVKASVLASSMTNPTGVCPGLLPAIRTSIRAGAAFLLVRQSAFLEGAFAGADDCSEGDDDWYDENDNEACIDSSDIDEYEYEYESSGSEDDDDDDDDDDNADAAGKGDAFPATRDDTGDIELQYANIDLYYSEQEKNHMYAVRCAAFCVMACWGFDDDMANLFGTGDERATRLLQKSGEFTKAGGVGWQLDQAAPLQCPYTARFAVLMFEICEQYLAIPSILQLLNTVAQSAPFGPLWASASSLPVVQACAGTHHGMASACSGDGTAQLSPMARHILHAVQDGSAGAPRPVLSPSALVKACVEHCLNTAVGLGLASCGQAVCGRVQSSFVTFTRNLDPAYCQLWASGARLANDFAQTLLDEVPSVARVQMQPLAAAQAMQAMQMHDGCGACKQAAKKRGKKTANCHGRR